MCSKPRFCSKVAQKGQICSRLLEPQKVAQKLPRTIGKGVSWSRLFIIKPEITDPPFRYSSLFRFQHFLCGQVAQRHVGNGLHMQGLNRRMFSYNWEMYLNWTVKRRNELHVELHHGEVDELRLRHRHRLFWASRHSVWSQDRKHGWLAKFRGHFFAACVDSP